MRNSASVGNAPDLSKDDKKKLETLLDLEREIDDVGLMARIACEKIERAFDEQGPNRMAVAGDVGFYFGTQEVEEIVFIVSYIERLTARVSEKFYRAANGEEVTS